MPRPCRRGYAPPGSRTLDSQRKKEQTSVARQPVVQEALLIANGGQRQTEIDSLSIDYEALGVNPVEQKGLSEPSR
jgi:hypothetical protein